MSNVGDFDPIYIRELDTYISLSFIERANEEERIEESWRRAVGDLDLLAGRFAQSHELQRMFGLTQGDWQFALYYASRGLSGGNETQVLESGLINGLLVAGHAHAIRRYASKEKLPPSAAQAAALPYGMTALIYRFFTEEGMTLGMSHRQDMMRAFSRAQHEAGLTAYEKTAFIRDAIYAVATDILGRCGPQRLGRKRMRQILALTRLHFSIMEIRHKNFAELARLDLLYEAKREAFRIARPVLPTHGARVIRNWQIQHLWPFSYYYPVPVREALERGKQHTESAKYSISRSIAINEIALIHCLMQASKTRRDVRCMGISAFSRGK